MSALRAAFRRERHQGGASQVRAVVDAAIFEHGLARGEVSAAVNTCRPCTVTEHAKRGGKLCLRDGGREVVELASA
jgi:hypothetical protein